MTPVGIKDNSQQVLYTADPRRISPLVPRKVELRSPRLAGTYVPRRSVLCKHDGRLNFPRVCCGIPVLLTNLAVVLSSGEYLVVKVYSTASGWTSSKRNEMSKGVDEAHDRPPLPTSGPAPFASRKQADRREKETRW